MPRPLPVHGEAEAEAEAPETLLTLREGGALTGDRKGPEGHRDGAMGRWRRWHEVGGEQVREIYGEQAYEERKRTRERASQPLVPSRVPSHDRPKHLGPECGGPERDSGPSR